MARPLSHSTSAGVSFPSDITPHRPEKLILSSFLARLLNVLVLNKSTTTDLTPSPARVKIDFLDLWQGPGVILPRLESRLRMILLLTGQKNRFYHHFLARPLHVLELNKSTTTDLTPVIAC